MMIGNSVNEFPEQKDFSSKILLFGEYSIILINLGHEPHTFEPGHKIGQLLVVPVARAEFIEVDELSDTARGEGGFGSTGK